MPRTRSYEFALNISVMRVDRAALAQPVKRTTSLGVAEYPEGDYDPDNGVALCTARKRCQQSTAVRPSAAR
jgi:hypothetical protein